MIPEHFVSAEIMLLAAEEEIDQQERRIKALKRIGFQLLTRLAEHESNDWMRGIEEELRG